MGGSIKRFIVILGAVLICFGIAPIKGRAGGLLDSGFSLGKDDFGHGVYDRLFAGTDIEVIKNGLIADKTINVKLLHGDGDGSDQNSGRIGSNYISLAYENSSGPLKFSTGYIYTAAIDENLALDDLAELGYREYKAYGHSPDWYLAVDLSHSILLTNDIILGFGAQISYLVDAFKEQDDKRLSLLFDLPVTIKNSVTISPEFQYTRSLAKDSKDLLSAKSADSNDKTDAGNFYGGVSITFAY